MIHIVGGTYLERCLEPLWQELFGSGGRSATALAQLDNEIVLSTYIGINEKPTLDILANTFGFSLNPIEINQTVSFDYYHPLSEPRIHPALAVLEKAPPIIAEAENILRFGFLEGEAIVSGDRVVYDPQDAFNPQLFSKNGSKADRLAIVANFNECRKLAGDSENWDNPELLGKKLLEMEKAEVVVIKRGSLGATVITSQETTQIPAYRTKKVWSIGSGDVFAAIFAHFWAVKKQQPFEAARLASIATAQYCNSKVLPVASEFSDNHILQPIEQKNEFPQKTKQVYLAGPFFTMAERWIVEQSRKYLAEQGFKVFSPLHDVGYGSAEEVAPQDIKALQDSEIVFAILDGLDAGTIFEIGYARSLNKPVIVFVQKESEENLKMIAGTGCEIVNDFVSAIYKTVWTAMQI